MNDSKSVFCPISAHKVKRIYEDDDFVIDKITGDSPAIRVSVFKDGHFVDEVFVWKELDDE